MRGFAFFSLIFVAAISALLAGTGMLASPVSAQSEAGAFVEKCRKEALDQYIQSATVFDSSAHDYEQQGKVWEAKTSGLGETFDKLRNQMGRFGDWRAFDNLKRSPAQVAMDDETYVKAAADAVSTAVSLLEKQQSNGPLEYCDYYSMQTHELILIRIHIFMLQRVLALEEMESYFRVRLAISSGVSTDSYNRESKEMEDALLDQYETEERSSGSVRRAVDLLVKN